MDFTPYLDDLARRLDVAEEQALQDDWLCFARGEWPQALFHRPRRPAPAGIGWPDVAINDAIDDPDAMLLDQLGGCSRILDRGAPLLLSVRCNYGVGILPTAFGAALFMMAREQQTLPIVRPLGREAIPAVLDAGQPATDAGLLARVWDCAERLQGLLEPYPELRKHIHLYHPDLQGPMDVCELLWGSDLFLDLYSEPELVQALLRLITDTYGSIMDRWQRSCPSRLPAGFSVHWGWCHRGTILLRDDSAMNLSPEMFGDFIAPYDGELLERYHGAVHFCGRGSHFVPLLARLPGLHAINMSQPQLNDLGGIFSHTIDRGIPLLGLDPSGVEAFCRRPQQPTGLVHATEAVAVPT